MVGAAAVAEVALRRRDISLRGDGLGAWERLELGGAQDALNLFVRVPWSALWTRRSCHVYSHRKPMGL